MQLSQDSIIKKRYLLLLLYFIVLIGNANSIDSSFVESPFAKFDIRKLDDIIYNFGEPLVYNKFSENSGKYIFIFYDGIRFIAYDNYNDNNYIFSAILSSPKIKLKNNIFVGTSKAAILKELGKPDTVNNDSIIYRGNSHYIVFFFDRFQQIVSISWLYYMD